MHPPRTLLALTLALCAVATACTGGGPVPGGAGTQPTQTPPAATGTATGTASGSPGSAAASPTGFPAPPAGRTVPARTWFVDATLGFGVDGTCTSGTAPLACTYSLSVSRDGGTTWRATGAPVHATQRTDHDPDLVFLSERQGWVYGDALYATTDGGSTWRRASDPSPGTQACGKLPEPVAHFTAGGRDQWAVAGDCGNGACPGLYTSAGGRGELCRADPQTPLQDARIVITAQAVFALVGGGRNPAWVARTLDGGRSWNLQQSPCGTDAGATLAAVGRSRMWLACYDEPVTGMQSGRIFENPDFGERWFVRSDTGRYGTNDPERPRTGSLPGDGHAGELVALPNGELVLTRSKFAAVYRSTDAGRTWNVTLNNPDLSALRLQFLDSRTGWAHAGVGLYRTTDGGRTWRLVAGTATV